MTDGAGARLVSVDAELQAERCSLKTPLSINLSTP